MHLRTLLLAAAALVALAPAAVVHAEGKGGHGGGHAGGAHAAAHAHARGPHTARMAAHRDVAGHGAHGAAGHPHADAAHVAMRNHWHADHVGWRGHVVWGHDHFWWRGNPAFAAYTGPRANLYFAPGFGYYHVPGEYWGRHWGVGALLPAFFLTYAVADFAAYGLPPPPPEASWVWVNNSVVLVNRSDGYVIDQMANVW